MFHTNKFRMVRLAATAVVIACAMPAGAATVSVSGSFTHYSGPVAYLPGSPEHYIYGPSYLNDSEVSPDKPSSRKGVGLLNYDFVPGTSSVEFYNTSDGPDSHNLLKFTPPSIEQSPEVGQEFLIGTFTLQNGSWFGHLGEGDSLFSFSVTTSSIDPLLDGHTFSDVIHFHVSVGSTPELNADYFSFDGRPDLGIMSVYESYDSPTGSNIGSIDLYGRIGSLIPTRFANAQGGAFIGAPVPEPETYALMLAGLGLLSFAASRRKQKAA